MSVGILESSQMVTQIVKNPPAAQETRVQSLGWEDPLRRKWQPTPVFLPGEFHGRGALWATIHGVAKSQRQLSDFHFHLIIQFYF